MKITPTILIIVTLLFIVVTYTIYSDTPEKKNKEFLRKKQTKIEVKKKEKNQG